jgi:hypothetical protein
MRRKNSQFAFWLSNSDYPASLEVGKLYRFVEDKDAAAEGYLRGIGESGEDYAFASDRFHIVELPAKVGGALTDRLELAP